MPNWIPSLYPSGRARLIPRRTSFNASRRSAESAARYSVTVDAGMGQDYRNGFDEATVIQRGESFGKTNKFSSSQFRQSFMQPRSSNPRGGRKLLPPQVVRL